MSRETGIQAYVHNNTDVSTELTMPSTATGVTWADMITPEEAQDLIVKAMESKKAGEDKDKQKGGRTKPLQSSLDAAHPQVILADKKVKLRHNGEYKGYINKPWKKCEPAPIWL